MKIPTASELIAAAKAASGDKDDFDLAALMRQRYGLRTTQSAISRWRTSSRGPSYEATVALLGLAGWLSEDRIQATGARAAAAVEARRAEENARALADRKEPARDRSKSA